MIALVLPRILIVWSLTSNPISVALISLSTIKTRLIEAFASSAVVLDDINVRLLLGQPVDLTEQAQVILAMVRVGSPLGLERKAKPIPTLADYLASKEPGE